MDIKQKELNLLRNIINKELKQSFTNDNTNLNKPHTCHLIER